MPFASKAQRRKFYAMESRGEISMKKVKEYERETKGPLPERVKKKHNPGTVLYADPKGRRLPIDTPKHVRASWRYAHDPKKMSMRSKADLARIRTRIRGAARRFGIKLEA